MGSTLIGFHYHFVFSTKKRIPQIDAAWRPRCHEYIAGTIRGLGGVPEMVGGVADHVHILAGLKPTHCVSQFMQELKKASSIWVHQEIGMRDFYWQEGYAGFTVSPTARKAVSRYIAGQEKHHRKKTFRDELIALLDKAEVPYKPEYLD